MSVSHLRYYVFRIIGDLKIAIVNDLYSFQRSEEVAKIIGGNVIVVPSHELLSSLITFFDYGIMKEVDRIFDSNPDIIPICYNLRDCYISLSFNGTISWGDHHIQVKKINVISFHLLFNPSLPIDYTIEIVRKNYVQVNLMSTLALHFLKSKDVVVIASDIKFEKTNRNRELDELQVCNYFMTALASTERDDFDDELKNYLLLSNYLSKSSNDKIASLNMWTGVAYKYSISN